MTDPIVNAMYALIVVLAFLGVLIAIAAPVEAAAKASPRFAAFLDRAIDRLFR